MNKRFNIRAAFEEAKEAQATAQLEVDKEASLSPEEKAIRDSALQLAKDQEPKEEEKDLEADLSEESGESGDAQEQADGTDKVEDEEKDKSEDNSENEAEGEVEVEDEEKVEDKQEQTGDDKAEDTPIDPDGDEAKEKVKQDGSDKEQEKDAVKVAATLEGIADVMERSLDKGGLSTMSASAVALVLEQLYDRVGIKYTPSSFPAMESYNSTSNRKRSTELALEAVKDTISQVWVAIKNSIARAAARMREMARMVAYSFRGYNGQIASIRSLIAKMTKDTTDKLYVSKSDIARLSIADKFDPVNAVKQFSLLSDTIRVKLAPSAIKDITNLNNVLSLDARKVEIKEIPKLSFDIKAFFPFAVQEHADSDVNNSFKNSKPLAGGYTFVATLPKPNLDTEQYQKSLLNVCSSLEGQEPSVLTQVPMLDKKDLLIALERAQELVAKIKQLSDSFSALESCFYEIEDNLDNSSSIGSMITGSSASGRVIGKAIDRVIEETRDRTDSQIKKQIILSIKAIERCYVDYSLDVYFAASSALKSFMNYTNASAKAYL